MTKVLKFFIVSSMPTEKKLSIVQDNSALAEIPQFGKLVQTLAARFEVTSEELVATIKAQCFPGGAATTAQLLMLLSFAKQYDLNPLAKECYAFISQGRMSVGVQVDGWSKIANRQENYDGQEIEYENDASGKTIAITSRTYVKGRAKPTVYRAVMSEWKRSTDVWNAMPTHQLYVKARNEGIRFAFGIPAYDPESIERIEEADNHRAIETTSRQVVETPQPEQINKEDRAPVPNVSAAAPELAGESTNAHHVAPEGSTEPSGEVSVTTEADASSANNVMAGSEEEPQASGVRTKLERFIAQKVPEARLNLLLGKLGVEKVEQLDEEQCAQLLRQLEKRGK